MGKVIAISTNKGGVLKTSVTVNLAGVMAQQRKRVLIVDTDNQGNCLLSFGMNPDMEKNTIYNVLVDGIDPTGAIRKVHDYISIIPANDDMQFFDLDVLTQPKKFPQPFRLMVHRLAAIREAYDYILIDTPPNLGLTQANVLSFADSVIIPYQPEQYSMRSLVKIIKAIGDFKAKQNPDLTISGVVGTLVDMRTVLHSQILQEGRRYCAEHQIHFYDTIIPRTVRHASSIAYDRLPLTMTKSKNQADEEARQAYFKLHKEVIEREKEIAGKF